MKSLYLRIWLTVVAALALFALVSGWMWQRHLEEERARVEQTLNERLASWAELVSRSLPVADAAVEDQASALQNWSFRLRVPLALDDALGQRLATSESYRRAEAAGGLTRATAMRLDDGRTLWLARRSWRQRGPDGPPPEAWLLWRPRGGEGMRLGSGGGGGIAGGGRDSLADPAAEQAPVSPGHGLRPPMHVMPSAGPLPPLPFGLPRAVGPLILAAMLFVAVAAGAFPVVRRLTRRLEALKQGVAAFGSGDLAKRVDESGRDEVAEVAATFNRAAQRVQDLVRSHQHLLANASHELRSPLARLKMAVAMLGEVPDAQRKLMLREINTNIAELDALVEEVLLASRLDAGAPVERHERVDLLGVAAEEAARVGAEVVVDGADAAPTADGADAGQATGGALQPLRTDGNQGWEVKGNERLLRRALRNLLENARRYGGDQVQVRVSQRGADQVVVQVCDRGQGVPDEHRERIFEPYFRLPGHAEREGGVGLGLSLVKQIAELHLGRVRCLARSGGGSVFELTVPV